MYRVTDAGFSIPHASLVCNLDMRQLLYAGYVSLSSQIVQLTAALQGMTSFLAQSL